MRVSAYKTAIIDAWPSVVVSEAPRRCLWRKKPKRWRAITRPAFGFFLSVSCDPCWGQPPFRPRIVGGPGVSSAPAGAVRFAFSASGQGFGPLPSTLSGQQSATATVPTFTHAAMTTSNFQCPNCHAEYKVVRVEAPPTHDQPLLCLSCGGPLNNREGKFALKYFRVDDGPAQSSRNNRKPHF
jgi:hypothetical protein